MASSGNKELSEEIKYKPENSEMTISECIQQLLKSKNITKWLHDDDENENENKEQYNMIKKELVRITYTSNKKREIVTELYPFVWISRHKSIENISKQQRESFEMQYKLTFYYKKDLYFAIFTATYQQIQSLHQTAIHHKRYFPTHKFPTGPTVFSSVFLINFK